MHKVLIEDLGPDFYAWRGRVDKDKTVCIATPRIQHDPEARQVVRDLVRRQGGDCDTCGACRVGRRE